MDNLAAAKRRKITTERFEKLEDVLPTPVLNKKNLLLSNKLLSFSEDFLDVMEFLRSKDMIMSNFLTLSPPLNLILNKNSFQN